MDSDNWHHRKERKKIDQTLAKKSSEMIQD